MSLFKKKTAAPKEVIDDLHVKADSPDGVDEVMKKYDQESNIRIWEGIPKMIVTAVLVFFSLFCIYVTLFATFLDQIRLTSFMGLIILMGFLVFPHKKGIDRINYMPLLDIIAMVLGSGAFFYYTFNAQDIINRGTNIHGYEVIIAIFGILALVEVTRRSVGLPILCVAGVFMIYAFVNGNFSYTIYRLFYADTGILTTPVNVCSKYIVVFVIFGAFLERTGISQFFIKLANAIAGSSSGGPAKVAVISSALCGMVSGSSVGNTVTTGSVTIPMMKDTGYKGEFAGAVEAAASTGGQIMPPIMGAAAFLMADFVGVPYSDIIVRAILPAVLYFAGIFVCVHLEAKKLGLKGISRDQLPRIGELLKKTYLLLPLIILIYIVANNLRTMQFAASIAIVAAIVVSLVNKDDRIDLVKFIGALEAGARSTISVAAACGMAGIIAGCITMTGLASILIMAIVGVAGNQLLMALVLTMLCCIVLGMGVPTTANYCIMATTCAPILMQMGVPALAAHFFVFYFGIVADITPPVALAAYAGSAIAKSNPMKTAFNATKLAIAAFIVPYVFAFDPALLFVNTTPVEVVLIIVTSLVGIFGVSAGLQGYIKAPMNPLFRILSIAGGLCLIVPGLATDLIGLAAIGGIIIYQTIREKKLA